MAIFILENLQGMSACSYLVFESFLDKSLHLACVAHRPNLLPKDLKIQIQKVLVSG